MFMKLLKRFPVITFLSLLVILGTLVTTLPAAEKKPYPIPAFTQTAAQEWLNSKPLTKKDLLGKVTFIDFWTFDCWNCYRSFPWLHGVEKQFKAKGFQVIGIQRNH